MKSVASKSSVSASAADGGRVRRVEHVEGLGAEAALDHLRARGSSRPSRAGRRCRSTRARRAPRRSAAGRRAGCASASARPASRATSPRRLPVQSVGSRSQIRATSSAGATVLTPASSQERRARARRTRVAAPCSARAPSPAIVAERASRDLARQPLGDRVHVRLVLVADQDQRRHLHVAEPPRQILDEQLLLVLGHVTLELVGLQLHLGDARTHRGIDVLGLAPRPVDPRLQAHLDRRVEVACLERGLLLRPLRPQLLRPFVSGHARRDQDERGDELGPCERDLERDPASERHADQRRLARSRAASSASITSRACANGPGSSGVRPKPRRSSRSTRKDSAYRSHCSSHMRLSQIPSCTSTSAGPFAGDLRVDRHAPRPQAETSSPRLAWMPSSSSVNESENFCTPSCSSVTTTSS